MELHDKYRPGRLDGDAEIYNPDRRDPNAAERWREMNTSERIKSFKEYYLKPIIIGIILLGIAAYFIYYLARPTEDELFFAALFNVYITVEDDDTMPGDFKKYLGLDDSIDNDRIIIKSYYDSILSDTEMNNFFAKKRYDIFITDEERFKTYAKTDNYKDLSETLPADVYEKYKDVLVYSNNQAHKDTDEEFPYGISLTDSKYTFYDEHDNIIKNPVAGIVINSKRTDTAIKFINFLMD